MKELEVYVDIFDNWAPNFGNWLDFGRNYTLYFSLTPPNNSDIKPKIIYLYPDSYYPTSEQSLKYKILDFETNKVTEEKFISIQAKQPIRAFLEKEKFNILKEVLENIYTHQKSLAKNFKDDLSKAKEVVTSTATGTGIIKSTEILSEESENADLLSNLFQSSRLSSPVIDKTEIQVPHMNFMDSPQNPPLLTQREPSIEESIVEERGDDIFEESALEQQGYEGDNLPKQQDVIINFTALPLEYKILDTLSIVLEHETNCSAVSLFGDTLIIGYNHNTHANDKAINKENVELYNNLFKFKEIIVKYCNSNNLEELKKLETDIKDAIICPSRARKCPGIDKNLRLTKEDMGRIKDQLLTNPPSFDFGKNPYSSRMHGAAIMCNYFLKNFAKLKSVKSGVLKSIKKSILLPEKPFTEQEYVLDEAHAEIQVLVYLLEKIQSPSELKDHSSGKIFFYIGISKLCCAHCHVIINLVNYFLKDSCVFLVRGWHDILYPEKSQYSNKDLLVKKIYNLVSKINQSISEEGFMRFYKNLLKTASDADKARQKRLPHGEGRVPVLFSTSSGSYTKELSQASKPLQLLPEGLTINIITGNGNCLYNAIALYLDQEQDINYLGTLVAEHLKNNFNEYQQSITLSDGETINGYINDIINTKKELPRDLEITILSKTLDRPIITIGRDGNVAHKQILDEHLNGEPIFVYYNNVNHYDSLILQEGYNAREILDYLIKKLNQNGTSKELLSIPQGKKQIVAPHEISEQDKNTLISDYGIKVFQLYEPEILQIATILPEDDSFKKIHECPFDSKEKDSEFSFAIKVFLGSLLSEYKYKFLPVAMFIKTTLCSLPPEVKNIIIGNLKLRTEEEMKQIALEEEERCKKEIAEKKEVFQKVNTWRQCVDTSSYGNFDIPPIDNEPKSDVTNTHTSPRSSMSSPSQSSI